MKKIEELFDLVKQSGMTLIGYTFKDERIKDELISNFNYVEIGIIDSSFSFKSFLRDIKLDSLYADKKTPEYILIDINNIKHDLVDIRGRHRQIRTALMKIKEDLYPEFSSVYPSTPKYKLIVTCSLRESGKNLDGNDINNFTGGSQPLFMADLAFVIYSDRIKVIKNRLGEDGDYILHNNKQSVEI